MRRSVSILTILLAFGVSVALGVSRANAKSCTSLLDQGSGLYSCEGVDESANPVTFDFRVDSINGTDFDASIKNNQGPYGKVSLSCSCRTKRKRNNIDFEILRSFECVSTDQTGILPSGSPFNWNGPTAYRGNVGKKGKTINHGEGVDEEHVSIGYTCDQVLP